MKACATTFTFILCVLQAEAQPGPYTYPAAALKFTKVQIASESFESAEVFDVNGDAHPDIVSGSYWYKGPDFKFKYFIGDVRREGEYYDDFSTIPYDVNEDGKIDFITGGWWGNNIRWRENPGNEGPWPEHVIATTGNVETTRAWDVDGDGKLEIVPNTPGKPLFYYQKESGQPAFTAHKVIDQHGHGLGFGDVNGDGHGDFIVSTGWVEAPATSAGSWTFHAEFDIGQGSVPIIVTDVNKDGLTDFIVGHAHDYGLVWYEQKMEKRARRWIRHTIDLLHSQFHAMLWTDLDNDGRSELITGKRYRAHNEKDPGSFDDIGLYYFTWNGESFTKQVVSYGPLGQGKGTGIYFAVADVDGNAWKDIVVAGKDGLFVFYNHGWE
ncbi:FG-GAP repeat domain-containing protein [Chryseolinea soli]|uniref:VCBS repeat-containing protein n=1 Tax=Chryseolinea soli TaxID=2321403 RepID=A0A385SQI0_9BACT|nr:VCBS repeat-containing protein [Chryseolinea soli]AYB32786.1 VCBS repeat-containing protein [Chryseolinea soli]